MKGQHGAIVKKVIMQKEKNSKMSKKAQKKN